MNTLLENLEKLHTTPMGAIRITNNLGLDTEPVEWCRAAIKSPDAVITKIGKNWYAEVNDCIITVNSYSYTIITAHKHKTKK